MSDKAVTCGNDIINDIFAAVKKGQENIVEVARQITDGNESIKFSVSNKAVLPEIAQVPPRMESPKRAHNFTCAGGLMKYLEKYKTEDTVIFIDAGNFKAAVVINEKSADGFEVFLMTPQTHNLIVPWFGLVNSPRPVSLLDFSDFLLTNRKVIVSTGCGLCSRELAVAMSQVKFSKKTDIQIGRGKNSINSVSVQTTIGAEKKTDIIDLPDEIIIKAPIFINTEPVEVTIDCVYDVVDEHPVVKCKSADMLERMVNVFDSMMAPLSELKGVTVVSGYPKWTEWSYVDQDIDRT